MSGDSARDDHLAVPDWSGQPGTHRAAPARKELLRAHNLRLILDNVIESTPQARLSRADLANATSLTRSTVSSLVDELLDVGLVIEEAPTGGAGAGRPAVPIAPAGSSWRGIGLEINVDYIGYRIIDLVGQVLAEDTAATPPGDDPHDRVIQLDALLGPVLATWGEDERCVGARLALPGLVDADNGTVLRAPNIGWRDVDIASMLASAPTLARIPVGIGNEASFGAVAELAARGRNLPKDSMVFVSAGVGIGASIVVRSQPFGGASGWAGELGHVCVDPAGPVCRCGARGCLEVFAGQGHVLAAGTSGTLALAEAGDSAVVERLDRAAAALGVALAGVINLVDVPTIVLGGFLAPLLPWMRARIEAELQTRVLSARWSAPVVEAAVAGPRTALAGAAIAALRPLRDNPIAWVRG